MKYFVKSFLVGLALCLTSLVGAAPAPDTNTVTATNDLRSEYHTFNVTIPGEYKYCCLSMGHTLTYYQDTLNTIEARGYDPSTEYQGFAQVEVWTGGDQRKPVNWGNLRGSKLSDTILHLLDVSCPWTSSEECKNDDWQFFKTKTLVQGSPNVYPFPTETRRASFKTEQARFATPGIRNVMAKIIAETLSAYTKNENGYNCYNHQREIFCNVPRKVRINLPMTSKCPDDSHRVCKYNFNRWQILTSSANPYETFSPFGDLRPCKTRPEVDMVMDKYKDDIVKEFPKYKKEFRRDARVIINGDKVCSDEL